MSKYISAEDNLMKYDKGAIIVYGSVYAGVLNNILCFCLNPLT